MNRTVLNVALGFGLISMTFACGDDQAGGGSGSASVGEETASGSDSDSDSNSSGSESGTMSQGSNSGDGDGDDESATGDGDGEGESASGDGDGDGGSGDGDGDGNSGSGDGDGDGSGSGDGDGDGGSAGTDACDEFEATVQPIPPAVMLLLDRSGSMNDTGFDLDDPDKSRWNSLYESVEAVISDGADETIAFGAKTFSTYNFGECGVSDDADVPVAVDNASAILDGIPGPLEMIVGGTPTNLAIQKTLTIMDNYDANGGSKIIFLVTDGLISCTDNHAESLAQAVEDLSAGVNDQNITTYVLGIAPSNSNQVINQLEQMAVAGGAPKDGPESFYRADDAEQLGQALADIVEDSILNSCLMALDPPPPFPDFTKVVVGDTEYDLIDDCENGDGFVYSKEDFTQIRVCGSACEELQLEGEALVQYFCTLQ